MAGIVVVAGCDDMPEKRPDPAVTPTSSVFADEAEELEYLAGLANPTPEQWKRRKHLTGRAAYKRIMEAKPADLPTPP
jgi:hypothetical protein